MKLRIFAVILIIAVLLSGCSLNPNTGIDTMLTPPKLNEQHEQIYQALIKALNTDLKLKYPKSGSNLSAFTVEDIDGDDEEEAIVFYERESVNVEERSLQINILDKIDGKWTSMYDYSAEGYEVERVMVSKLGESQQPNIIVGYNMVNTENKQLYIYNYKDGILYNTLKEPYDIVDVRDIDEDNLNELFIISGKVESQPAKARVLKLSEDGKYYESFVNLNNNIMDFLQMVYGKIGDNSIGIYIDELVGSNTILTEILKFENGELKTLYKQIVSEDENESYLSRPASHKTIDIDGDGILEIPQNVVFPGYKDYPDTEKLYMTDWFIYEEDESVSSHNVLTKKYESYYSVTYGYSFMFPKRWQGQITAKVDSINNEVILYKFDNEITDDMEEVLRIAVVDKQLIDDKTREGYKTMKTKGETAYLVYIPENEDEPLIPTESEVMFNFILY